MCQWSSSEACTHPSNIKKVKSVPHSSHSPQYNLRTDPTTSSIPWQQVLVRAFSPMDSFSSCASHHKPFVHRMAAVNRCNVAFMVYDGSCHRQLSTFQSAELREQFENFVISIGASKFGDWYKFANLNQNLSAVGKTLELGGICYDLPFRTKSEGILHIL